MPQSVLLVSDDANLMDSVRGALLPDDRFLDADGGLHCDGSVVPWTNIYPVEMAAVEWDGWEPGAGPMPDPRSMSVLIFECRSPAWIAEVGTLLKRGLEAPAWFVDSAGTAWPADGVDQDRIVLT